MPDSPTIKGYHAHIYYDAETKPKAARLRTLIEEHFNAQLGRWHDNPVGPHPMGSYQIAFAPELFAELTPWLALNRDGLIVFLHPETGDELADHRDRAMWMGHIDGKLPQLDLTALE